MKLIMWCNENAGFKTALSTIATIVVAVLLARLPYRKVDAINTFLSYEPDGTGEYTLCIQIANIGNVPFCVQKIKTFDKQAGMIGEYSSPLAFPEVTRPFEENEYTLNLVNCNAFDEINRHPMRIKITTNVKEFRHRIGWAVG